MDPIRVLILEDDEDIVELLKSILEQEGYETISAENGLEGLQMAEAGEPDLIVCDIMMPLMDGWEFVRALRQRPSFQHTPVIYLSALSSQEMIRKGYDLGAALYLTKPINAPRLKRNIELFISDHALQPRHKLKRIDQLRMLKLVSPPPRAAEAPPAPRQAAPPPKPVPPTEPAPRKAQPEPAPLPEPSPVPPVAPKKAVPEAQKTPAEKIRIMVVDDDKDTCQMLSTLLGEEFDVIDAHDGITAIERAIRYKPDLFIIDGMLPRLTGYQLTMMLKKNREFYKAPIVMISGKASSRDQEYARSLGITHFVAKPFTPQQIVEVTHAIVRQADFTRRTDRISIKQAVLENFTHLEAHRQTSETPTLSEIEYRALSNRLKQQLSE